MGGLVAKDKRLERRRRKMRVEARSAWANMPEEGRRQVAANVPLQLEIAKKMEGAARTKRIQLLKDPVRFAKVRKLL